MTADLPSPAVAILVRPLAVVLAASMVMIATGIFLRLRTVRNTQRWRDLEALWTPALLSILSGDLGPESLHELVLPGNRFSFVQFLTRYVHRFSGEERVLLYRLAAPYLPQIATRARQGDAESRAYALQTLSALGLSGYSDTVLQALDDESTLVAIVSAQELARSGNAQFAGAILARLGRFDSWSTRYLASLLAGLGRGAVPAFRSKLADREEAPRVRAIVATALHLLKDAGAAGLAAEICENESDRDLVIAALAIIGDLGRPEHLEVVRALSWSPDFVIRAQAVETLGRVGETNDTDRLELALSDENPWVSLRAATALRQAGSLEVLRHCAETGGPGAVVSREALMGAAS